MSHGVERLRDAGLDAHLHVDLGVAFVADDVEVVKRKVVDVGNVALDGEFGEGQRLALELEFERFDVVLVDVGVAHGKGELFWLAVGDLCDHVGEQSVAGDVEGDAEAQVARALVHLAREVFLALTPGVCVEVGDEKLAKHVAGGQRH